jgi:hypothetical protein
MLLAVLGAFGVIGAGCLSRPVYTYIPNVKINFTTTVTSKAVNKLDLLFMIDNSASMGDKQALLALAIPDMINRLVSPNCVDANGNYLGASNNGACATGQIEFPPVHDMHLGIVTSSLGSRGGDECPDGNANPVNMSLSAHMNDQGELIARGGVAGDPTIEGTVADSAANGNFLAWYPASQSNTAANAPPKPLTTVGPGTASATGSGDGTLIGDFQEEIEGVHEHGCGFEAQNEAWYRFLIQPDPFATISVDSKSEQASVANIDQNILSQRAAFLRPDSLVAVIVVTDENEEVSNPNAVYHQAWAFEATQFPGSPTGTAPEGTTDCQQNVDPANTGTTGPNNPNCTSCGFTGVQGNASRCPNNGMSGTNGYLSTENDFPNIRFYHQKYRFGVDAGYPTTRYVRGLTKTSVPDMCHETLGGGGPGPCGNVSLKAPSGAPPSSYVGDQDANANCVNPLFAENLPTSPTDELCKLTPGPRTPDLVFYAAIAGVPHQLLQAQPGQMDMNGNIDCPAGTNAADCPQKSTLSPADWLKITGADPENYDFTGADFHMVESPHPRVMGFKTDGNTVPANFSSCPPPGTGGPTTAGDTCDPVNGREWDTTNGMGGLGQDLQFACIFPLVDSTGTPAPKDCTSAKYTGACDCGTTGTYTNQTQLCQISGGKYTTTQINGKAYPSVREMVIAHSMGQQGIVSSLCPIHPTPVGGAGDPLFGYRPAVTAIVNRLKNALANVCTAQKLTPDPTCGNVPCLIIAQQVGGMGVGAGACANPGAACNVAGLIGPSPDDPNNPPEYSQSVANTFCNSLHTAWLNSGGTGTDPATIPACAIHQLIDPANQMSSTCADPADPMAFQNGSCSASNDAGWCYVTGAAANGCPQAILFTQSMPPPGWSASLQCIETSCVNLGGGASTCGDGG